MAVGLCEGLLVELARGQPRELVDEVDGAGRFVWGKGLVHEVEQLGGEFVGRCVFGGELDARLRHFAEIVDPVVLGKARAVQVQRADPDTDDAAARLPGGLCDLYA